MCCLPFLLPPTHHWRKYRARKQLRREAQIARNTYERRNVGLLNLALRSTNSVNSLTDADPGRFYREREGNNWFAKCAEKEVPECGRW
ncbi:hypothetical protein Tdes44962_MAKER03458 [Teratosphaeria destructans]|uniref:Uncharacterized protein n=1 Tax=Teratosphaeria destructans TaxID=418781 RepID=A0A9W7W1L1_9PEZI|nr:hypothetical protein Tdes44962_MAKER03458 [Teratosphaeria destructans]